VRIPYSQERRPLRSLGTATAAFRRGSRGLQIPAPSSKSSVVTGLALKSINSVRRRWTPHFLFVRLAVVRFKLFSDVLSAYPFFCPTERKRFLCFPQSGNKDQMADLRCRRGQSKHRIFDLPICLSKPLVLPEVLCPGRNYKDLDEMIWVLYVPED
jgi:hypothetical protein